MSYYLCLVYMNNNNKRIMAIIERQKKTNELEKSRLASLYKAIVTPRHVESSITLSEFTNTNDSGLKKYDDRSRGFIEKINVEHVRRRGINRIVNVYQLKYRDDKNVTGLGDFIRGCYYTLYTCEMCDISCNIFVNHPISVFLKNQVDNCSYPEMLLQNIKIFAYNNCEDPYIDDNNGKIRFTYNEQINGRFVSYLCNEVPIMCNAAFIYNIVYPYHNISQEHKNIMQNILLPNYETEYLITQQLLTFGIREKGYCVIHIRNDDYNTYNSESPVLKKYVMRLCGFINGIVKYNECILLISNNLHLKRILHVLYPSIRMTFNEVTHLNETIKEKLVVNTMLDFYLMSRSYLICCLTTYVHGSGFSQWCAETYNIKYECKYLPL
jgi:hypothetical protein